MPDRPRHRTEPRVSWVTKKVQFSPAVGGHRPAAGHVDLGPLAVELRLGHVAGVVQSGWIPEDLAEHRGNEAHVCLDCTVRHSNGSLTRFSSNPPYSV
jgi:hypothetical protein